MDEHSLDCLDFARLRELLAGYAATSLGKGLAGGIKPATRLDLVSRWLRQITEMAGLIELRGTPPFAGVTDVRETVRRCAPPLNVYVEDVAAIGRTLAATHELAKWLSVATLEQQPELRHLAERIGDFQPIAERIGRVIDDRDRVRDEASPKLLRIRREIAGVQSQVAHTVDRLVSEPGVRRWLQFPQATAFNDRLVLPVKTEYRGRVPGIIHRASDSGATLYVEPSQAVELNNRINGLRAEELEEINRLLWELAHLVYINGEPILRTIDALAVLDLITAKVRFANHYRMRCPEVVDEPRLSVRSARHPLLIDLVERKRAAGEPTPDVVPISYRLGEDFDLLIITGPNTGGKTVTLKTIGLLSLMVQAGLPAPCEHGSVFGIFRDIFIDIGDEQSMQQSLSTFSAHLARQMQMLQRAGPHTLMLLDELGAGTDPDEGAAIGKALLDELLRLKAKALATTHLGALKTIALQRERAENGCVEFDLETLRPTYRLIIGQPGASNAIAIAQRLGMPKRIVAAAQNNLSRKTRAFHAALEGTLEAKRQAEAARDAAETARLDADRTKSEAESARVSLDKQREAFSQWASQVTHLKPGDAVRIRDFDRDGKVVRVRLDLQRAEIDVGAFTVEVPLGDIYPPQAPAPPPKPPRPPQPPREQQSGGRRNREETPQGGHAGHPPNPGTAAPRGGGGDGPPRGGARPPQGRPPPAQRGPSATPLTREQIEALQPGDRVHVSRFQRDGRVVRVNGDKKTVVVSLGLMEVEAPFDGLAAAPAGGGRR